MRLLSMLLGIATLPATLPLAQGQGLRDWLGVALVV